MNIITLNEDLDTLLQNWPANVHITAAQQKRWPASKPLQHKQLGMDEPECLRLLVEEGGDGESVFSVKERTTAAFFWNSDHRWPGDNDLIRAGRFFHLELERTLALVLKGQWERFFEVESRIDMEGKTKRKWASRFQSLPLLEALKTFVAEACQLSLEFNPGLGRGADATGLFELFESLNGYASHAGYDGNNFKTLIHEMIMGYMHLFGINSPELLDFTAKKRKERELLKQASHSEQDDFWRAKLVWLASRRELENWLLTLENERLKAANLNQKWLAHFGELYQQVMETQYQVISLQRRIEFKQADPGLAITDLSRLEQQVLQQEHAQLEALRQDIAMAKLVQLLGHNGTAVDPETLADYDKKSKRILLEIHRYTHPDRWPKGFTEKQQQDLLAFFQEARKIVHAELGLDRRSYEKLLEIREHVKAIWDTIGLEIDARQIIRGETLSEQRAWLESEITRLEQEAIAVRNEMLTLGHNPDLQEKKAALASADTIAQLQRSMEEKLAEYQKQIKLLEQRLADLFKRGTR